MPGDPITKAELMETIRRDREQFDAIVAEIPRERLKERGLGGEGWTVKDVLWHIAWGERQNEGSVRSLPLISSISPMRIGVPRETVPGERRVALVPETVQKLIKGGNEVIVERGAGTEAAFPDAAYESAGATIVPDAFDAELVAKVQKPTEEEIGKLRSGSALIAFLQPLVDPKLARTLAERGVTALSMDAIPRITRAQPMDALSSQATVAGYKAVLLASATLPKFLPMLTTAAGTIAPAKAFVIGAGVAGLQAIATARRLGAVVEAFDTRPVVKEQVQSLGAKFLEIDLGESGEGAGGYAKELSEEAHRKEVELLAKAVRENDIVITTAAIPGRRAPVLITADMVRAMKPGAVIVDIAAETGGNCELTEAGKTVNKDGVTIIGTLNLPSTMPFHASQMYSRNIASLLALLISKDGQFKLDWEDEIVKGTVITHGGQVVHEATKKALGAAANGPSDERLRREERAHPPGPLAAKPRD